AGLAPARTTARGPNRRVVRIACAAAWGQLSTGRTAGGRQSHRRLCALECGGDRRTPKKDTTHFGVCPCPTTLREPAPPPWCGACAPTACATSLATPAAS